MDIFKDSEEGEKVLGELDKEDDEENGKKSKNKGRRNSDPTSGEFNNFATNCKQHRNTVYKNGIIYSKQLLKFFLAFSYPQWLKR